VIKVLHKSDYGFFDCEVQLIVQLFGLIPRIQYKYRKEGDHEWISRQPKWAIKGQNQAHSISGDNGMPTRMLFRCRGYKDRKVTHPGWKSNRCSSG
jgi:hypothetical protein